MTERNDTLNFYLYHKRLPRSSPSLHSSLFQFLAGCMQAKKRTLRHATGSKIGRLLLQEGYYHTQAAASAHGNGSRQHSAHHVSSTGRSSAFVGRFPPPMLASLPGGLSLPILCTLQRGCAAAATVPSLSHLEGCRILDTGESTASHYLDRSRDILVDLFYRALEYLTRLMSQLGWDRIMLLRPPLTNILTLHARGVFPLLVLGFQASLLDTLG